MIRIFFFGYTDFTGRMKAASLKKELERHKYECFLMEPPCYVLPVGEIAAQPKTGAFTGMAEEKLPEPFILFCSMNGEPLDTALDLCRGNTRAVLTVFNSRMTVCELSRHLLEEKRSLGKR